MITLAQVRFLIDRHKSQLAMNRKPGTETSLESVRWAFLVTMDEIDTLVDEIMEVGEAPKPFTHGSVTGMTPEFAKHVKAGKAMLHIDGTPILPELMIVPTPGGLDG